MKRRAILLPLLTAVTLPLAAPAGAARAMPTTLYLHGASALGEQDGVNWVASTFTESALTLSPTKPTGDSKSMSYAGMVNDVCTGVPLYPTFAGKLDGTVGGAVTLTLHSLSAPGTYTARIWFNTDIFQCNADYSPPAGEVEFDVPAGQSTSKVVVPIPNKKDRVAKGLVTVMVYAPTVPAYRGQVGRLMYDGAATPSSLSVTCAPRTGHKTCTT